MAAIRHQLPCSGCGILFLATVVAFAMIGSLSFGVSAQVAGVPAEGGGGGPSNNGFLDEDIKKSLKTGFGESLAGVPIELMWKDLYPFLVHDMIGSLVKRVALEYKRRTKYRHAVAAAHVVMLELEYYLYGADRANKEVFGKLRRVFEQYLIEWWDKTPQDPLTSLRVGLWKSLMRLFTSHLQEQLRGTSKLQKMMELLFDKELSQLKRWTNREHIRIMSLGMETAREAAIKQLRAKEKAE